MKQDESYYLEGHWRDKGEEVVNSEKSLSHNVV